MFTMMHRYNPSYNAIRMIQIYYAPISSTEHYFKCNAENGG